MKQFCKNGHDILIVGRTKAGSCRMCTNEANRRWREKNREKANQMSSDWKKAHPEKVKSSKKRWYDKYAEKFKEDKQLNPDKYRNFRLKTKFGISLEQYNSLLEVQQGKCAICGKHQSEFKRALAVDHNHITGQIRGLLCDRCNIKLGILENEKFCTEATSYLNRFKEIK